MENLNYHTAFLKSEKDLDKSSSSGVRVCYLDLSEFVENSHTRRQIVFYKSFRFVYA